MMKVKYYKCPACAKKFKTLNAWGKHLDSIHPGTRPEGYSISRYFYYIKTGKEHGSCRTCKKPTSWNEQSMKYNQYCDDPKCKEAYVKIAKTRMIGKYGKVHLLNDPNIQKKMLSHRKIASKFRFYDGTEFEYVGSYEKQFLILLNTLGWCTNDLIAPSPHVYYYDYKNENDLKEHQGEKFYIPDFYIPSMNLEIEIKQQTSTNEEFNKINRVKERLKDEVMASNKHVNYLKINDNDFAPFFQFIMDMQEREPEVEDEKKDQMEMVANESYLEPAEEACKDVVTARKFLNEVDKIGKKYDANFFIVTDGASMTRTRDGEDCDAIRNARNAQKQWEKENGFDPDEDWKNGTGEYYRVTYKGEGIYEALRKVVPMNTWREMLNQSYMTWLPKPPTYATGNRSYFTKYGYELFEKTVLPIIKTYLDPRYIKTEKITKIGKQIYADQFQIVTESLGPTPFKSSLDGHFQKKPLLRLSQFKKLPINKNTIKKYQKDAKVLEFVGDDDITNDYIGYIFTNSKDEFVAIVGVDRGRNGKGDLRNYNWIMDIEVAPKYRGHGLTKQLLDIATKELKGDFLTVNYDNQVAINAYKNYGFKIGKRSYDEIQTGTSKSKMYTMFYHMDNVDVVEDEPIFSSPQELSDWMKSNIAYKEFDRLMAPEEVMQQKKGSCHDQVMFELEIFKQMGIPHGTIFFIEYNEGEMQGGRTHSLVYFLKGGKYYWFENAWGGHEGIHGPFRSLNDLKNQLYKENKKGSNYKELEFSSLGEVKPGMDLSEFVSVCLGGNESFVIEKEYEIANEKYFRTTDDIFYNKEKFDAGETNICFITGQSGRGKSTMGKALNSNKVEWYDCDRLIEQDQKTEEYFRTYNKKGTKNLFYQFLFQDPIGKKYRITIDDIKKNPYFRNGGYESACINDFIDFTIRVAMKEKSRKFLLEGIWIYMFVAPEKLQDYAVFIKGTSTVTSMYRAVKRDLSNGTISNSKNLDLYYKINSTRFRLRQMFGDEKYINQYRTFFSKENATEEFNTLPIIKDMGFKDWTPDKYLYEVTYKGKPLQKIVDHIDHPFSNGVKKKTYFEIMTQNEYDDFVRDDLPLLRQMLNPRHLKITRIRNNGERIKRSVLESSLINLSHQGCECYKLCDHFEEVHSCDECCHGMESYQIAMEEANYSRQNKYPVFIVLMHTGTLLANIIKKFTRDEFSHACISFNSKLDPMYSFGNKQIVKMDLGLTIGSPRFGFFKTHKSVYSVYVMYVNKASYDAMQTALKKFTATPDAWDYDFINLLSVWMGRPSENSKKYFCSRFCMEVISKGRELEKVPSLYRPQEMAELNDITLVNHGTDFYNYNYKVTERNLKLVKKHKFDAIKAEDVNKAIESFYGRNVISTSESFEDVTDIVKTLSKKELLAICDGTFRNSPYVIFRKVILTEDDPAAFVDVYQLPDMKKDEGAVCVACKPQYRGQKYALVAINEMMNWANRNPKIKKLFWHVRELDNYASIHLAEKLGFQKTDHDVTGVEYEISTESCQIAQEGLFSFKKKEKSEETNWHHQIFGTKNILGISNFKSYHTTVEFEDGLIEIKGINYRTLKNRIKKFYEDKSIENIFLPKYNAFDYRKFEKKRMRKAQMRVDWMYTYEFFALELVRLFADLGKRFRDKIYERFAEQIYQESWLMKADQKAEEVPYLDTNNLKNLTLTLNDYQKEFIEKYPKLKAQLNLNGYILAFEQGLGKTLTAIALSECLDVDHVYIVCPNSLKENWALEIQKYYQKYQDDDLWKQEVFICSQSPTRFDPNTTRFIITNNESIEKMYPYVMSGKNMLILD